MADRNSEERLKMREALNIIKKRIVSAVEGEDETAVDERYDITFPHCDPRVLHAPGECEYCDLHPDWQELRKTWGIAFTGHDPVDDQCSCPADFARPQGSNADHRNWYGNVARRPGGPDRKAAIEATKKKRE